MRQEILSCADQRFDRLSVLEMSSHLKKTEDIPVARVQREVVADSRSDISTDWSLLRSCQLSQVAEEIFTKLQNGGIR